MCLLFPAATLTPEFVLCIHRFINTILIIIAFISHVSIRRLSMTKVANMTPWGNFLGRKWQKFWMTFPKSLGCFKFPEECLRKVRPFQPGFGIREILFHGFRERVYKTVSLWEKKEFFFQNTCAHSRTHPSSYIGEFSHFFLYYLS